MFEDDENKDTASEIVSDEFRVVQQALSDFVKINYDGARSVEPIIMPTHESVANIKGKILDIIRNNPPLATVPKYYRDGREDYLWYSDFYDDITKDTYHRYRTFVKPVNEITIRNYAEELEKIDLPYFKELVSLVSLERLLMDYEAKLLIQAKEIKPVEENFPKEEEPAAKETEPEIPVKPKLDRKQLSKKRTYEPKLTDKQYALLIDCIETIKLFRRPVKVTELKKLLAGKLIEPLQVANQKSLVYFLDQLSESKYIKEKWMSVADGNKDFISFRSEGNKQRYGDETHYIPMQQFLNDRNRNRREAVRGLIEIEETIEQMDKFREK